MVVNVKILPDLHISTDAVQRTLMTKSVQLQYSEFGRKTKNFSKRNSSLTQTCIASTGKYRDNKKTEIF